MSDYNEDAEMRVLAIHTINNDQKFATVFGRGKMLGSFYPDTAVGHLAHEVRAEGPDARNPKIELDNGDIIWGCECWWMEGHRGEMWLMELVSHGYKLIDVNISEMRALFAKEEVNDGSGIPTTND